MRLQSKRLGCITEDLGPFLKNIICPTLIIRGKDSPFLLHADLQKMCKIIPGAKAKEIPMATHMPAQENFRAFQKEISEFLRDVKRKQHFCSLEQPDR